MLDRLVIGTANWGQNYNGYCVDEKEQNLIMEYMKEVGIGWLDVATAYGTLGVGLGEFKRIVKVGLCGRDDIVSRGDIKLCHKAEWFHKNPENYDGVSIDSSHEDAEFACGAAIIEYPYSIMNKWGINLGQTQTIARSIFCKGKALQYFSPRECLDFVLMNPRIDKVIIGVDSVDQLASNIKHLVKMETFTHDEETDTRKF